MSDQNQTEPEQKYQRETGEPKPYDKLFAPRPLIPADHEHYLRMGVGERFAKCDCGFGGPIYPHNARLVDGHVYNLEGKKIV